MKNTVPKLVVTINEEKVDILWNQKVHIDRTIPNNKMDIIIRGNVKGTCIKKCCNIMGQPHIHGFC
jgi:hypothetical protein